MPKIKRIGGHKDFTLIENECLRDTSLDTPERGLLATMISLPDGWDFSGLGLTSILPCGKSRVFGSLKKLEAAGYLRRTRLYENGRVVDWQYEICGRPVFRDSNLDTDNREVGSENLDTDFQEVGFPEVEKQEVENRYDNIINNNQELNNQESINQSSGELPETDGLMDGFTEPQETGTDQELPHTVETVLPEIGYSQAAAEPDMQEIGLDNALLQQCRIPYWFTRSKRTMEITMRIITGYDYYHTSDNDALFRMINSALAALASTEQTKCNGQSVSYAQVIDKLNEMLAQNGCLIDWVEGFMQEWRKIMQERLGVIKNQAAYLKSCLWTYMNVSDFEEENLILSIPDMKKK